ncbi:hypothetical protein HYX19_01465 [Candidatus Woesearchaeota archaeon]|nr:hypothetical protein [Candidatus Woesearchaeota archaeon]
MNDEKTYVPEEASKASHQTIPLERYIETFTERYEREQSFRDIVNRYLGIRFGKRFKISMLKVLKPTSYKREVDVLIKGYAVKIKEEAEKAIVLTKELEELKEAKKDLDSRVDEIETFNQHEQKAEEDYETSVHKKGEAEQQVKQEYGGKIQKEIQDKKEAEKKITSQGPEELIRQELAKKILNSPFIKKADSGKLRFDDTALTHKLEDIFLEEIVREIEDKEGKLGFMQRTKSDYEGLIAYFDEIEDLSELSDVDWIDSTIYSRTKGYRVPQFPFLITGKPESKLKVMSCLDSAITFDTSGSMEGNKRFEIGQKTTLATHSLMRQLNSKNKVLLTNYSDTISQITTTDLIKSVSPHGGTRTDLALQWLIDTLKDSGLSLAYLITDGEPTHPSGNPVEECIKIARKFRDYPHILFRIFLIDGNETTENNIRKIGSAAGPNTKVMPIKNYMLPSGMIKDIASSIKEMYSIEQF